MTMLDWPSPELPHEQRKELERMDTILVDFARAHAGEAVDLPELGLCIVTFEELSGGDATSTYGGDGPHYVFQPESLDEIGGMNETLTRDPFGHPVVNSFDPNQPAVRFSQSYAYDGVAHSSLARAVLELAA